MASITLRTITGGPGSTTKGSGLTLQEIDDNFNNINVAKLEIPTANGIVSRTGTNITVGRTITGSGTNIVVTNGDGVSGNPTLDVGANIPKIDTQNSFNATNTFKGIRSTVFTITDGTTVDIDPANGTIQTWVLGANRSPTATNFQSGQFVTLMIADGTLFNVTWTGIGVVWVNNVVPTLPTSGYAIIELWKVGTTVYGTKVGDVA